MIFKTQCEVADLLRIGVTVNGDRVVILPEIIYKNKQKNPWRDVEDYLIRYVGEIITVSDTQDIIYIGDAFPDEYAGSNYTRGLRGARAKAKANAVQGIIEMIEIATGRFYNENQKEKHSKDAKFGWYYYKARFALPILNNNGVMSGYSVYVGNVVVNFASNNKLYLYDITDIKKEAGNPLKL